MEVGGIGAGNPAVNLYGVRAARSGGAQGQGAVKEQKASDPVDVVSISGAVKEQGAVTKAPVEASPKAAKPEGAPGHAASTRSALSAESGSGDTDNDGDGRGGRINVRV